MAALRGELPRARAAAARPAAQGGEVMTPPPTEIDVDPAVRAQQLAEAVIRELIDRIGRDRRSMARCPRARRADPLPVADTAKVLLRLMGVARPR